MIAPDKDNEFLADCKVEVQNNECHLTGSFHAVVSLTGSGNPLDLAEQQVEQIGQQLKRLLLRETLEAADEQYVQLLKQTSPHLRRHGKTPFTLVTRFGKVALRRNRLFNPQTRTTIKPSAALWQTSQRQHITQQVREAACNASQEVSYRKAAKQLANEAGEKTLISPITVWNIKQTKGQELLHEQNDFVEKAFSQQEVALPCGVPSQGTRRLEVNTIQVQADEVQTKSQEPGKKVNLTYTATLETTEGKCHPLAAASAEQLTRLIGAYFLVLGLYLGKRLEVLSDGARWISDWVGSVSGVEVSQVLCWYHLRKRIYESLGAVGLPKARKKLLQREILRHLWRGRVAEAVWILWGVRGSSRVPERITDLMGYLLRKRRIIVDYEVRRERGLWLASTRVEKWNDRAVAIRCKHNGMSWTQSGVLAVALYAEKNTHHHVNG